MRKRRATWSAERSWRAGSRLAIACLALLATIANAGCAMPFAALAAPATPTATLYPTLTPPPTPTPLPTATPLPSVASIAHVSGWQSVTSPHWAGYTFPRWGVTGIRAQWTEPAVNGDVKSEEFVWIGIGGWNSTANNLIQVGTFAYFPAADSRAEGVWYEAIPQEPYAQYPHVEVYAGDQIFAEVVEVKSSPQTWRLLLVDATTGATFDKTMQFGSLQAYPSFVMEDPNDGPASVNGPFYPFPRWGSVHFSAMQIRIGSVWTPAASLYAYRITMLRNGQTLATAGAMTTASGFTVSQP